MKIYPVKSDSRYSIELEYCGHAKPQQVLRFDGKVIASSPFLSSMVIRAVGHKAQRDGALVVEDKPA